MWPRKEHIYRNASVFTTFMLLRSLLRVCVYTFVQCLIAHCYDSSRLQLPFITLMMVTLKRKLKPVNLKHLAISSHESVMERCCVKCLDAYLYYISACCDTPFASREPSQWRILWKHTNWSRPLNEEQSPTDIRMIPYIGWWIFFFISDTWNTTNFPNVCDEYLFMIPS